MCGVGRGAEGGGRDGEADGVGWGGVGGGAVGHEKNALLT